MGRLESQCEDRNPHTTSGGKTVVENPGKHRGGQGRGLPPRAAGALWLWNQMAPPLCELPCERWGWLDKRVQRLESKLV